MRENHGLKQTPAYISWCNMKTRCNNPNFPDYKNWGGRGIKVCKEWNESFLAFLADMGQRPAGATLERIDNDGNYTPENCRWATRLEQSNNRRMRSDNTSGYRGINYHKPSKRWVVRLYRDGKRVTNGKTYKTLAEAVEAQTKLTP